MPKTCLHILPVALLAISGVAQSESDKARDLLLSKLPVDRAWGAHHAAESGDEQLTPALLRSLVEIEHEQSREHVWARLAIADALYRLESVLPTSELARLAKTNRVVAIVLAAKEPRRHEDLLVDMVGTERGPAWLAACNTLVQIRSNRLAAPLLRELEITLQLRVFDRDDARAGGGRRFGTACGHHRFAVPEGFPPLALHYLDERVRSGQLSTMDGPHPVHHRRVVCQPGQRIGTGGSRRTGEDNPRRCDYLAALLDTAPAKLGVSWIYNETLICKSAEAFVAKATAARADVEGAWGAVVERLVESRLLDSVIAVELRPRLRVVVHDRRDDRSQPLPALPTSTGQGASR